MLKEGDYILCKRDHYDGDTINNDGSMNGKSYKKYINLLKKPIFKNGNKYKIENITETIIPAGSTSGLYHSPISPQYHHYRIYKIFGYIIGLSEKDIEVLFYNKKEERALKLKRLQKI